jgi:hypothetical protein
MPPPQGVAPRRAASGPRPWSAKADQISQALDPPVRIWSAWTMASRASKKLGARRRGTRRVRCQGSRAQRGGRARDARRPAGLELHAVHDELDGKRVAVLGDERLGERPGRVELGRRSVVVVWLGRVGRREEGRREAVLGNEVLGHDEQELGPDLADRVNAKVCTHTHAQRSRGPSLARAMQARERGGGEEGD